METEVLSAWVSLMDHAEPEKKEKDNGEEWRNPHWFLNGDWWGQLGEDDKLGFVEGYLKCQASQVHSDQEVYSKSPANYRRRIDAFVKAHPKLGKEAVADPLRRFIDPVLK